MAPNKTLAAQLANELRELLPEQRRRVLRLATTTTTSPRRTSPQTDTYIEKDSSINEDVERLRHSATRALLARRDVVVVASVSCIYGLGSPQTYLDRSVQARRSARRSTATRCCARWSTCSTRATTWRFARGTFRVRGDTVEIFPAYEELAIRIEFFGDEIESLYYLQSAHRRGGAARSRSVRIFPATHYVAGPERMERAIEAHRAGARGAAGRAGERRASCWRPSGCACARSYDIEMMRQVGFCSGIENYSRHIDGRGPASRRRDADRLLPRRLPAGHRRVARDGAADRRHVRGRHVAQAQPRRVRLPAAHRASTTGR